jgi:hypothetical protein
VEALSRLAFLLNELSKLLNKFPVPIQQEQNKTKVTAKAELTHFIHYSLIMLIQETTALNSKKKSVNILKTN